MILQNEAEERRLKNIVGETFPSLFFLLLLLLSDITGKEGDRTKRGRRKGSAFLSFALPCFLGNCFSYYSIASSRERESFRPQGRNQWD